MTCAEVIKKNTGLSRCKLPSMFKGMILLPKGTEISIADFQSLAAWNTLLLNPYGTRAWLFPWFRQNENQSEETVYEQTPLSSMKVRDGQYRWRFQIRESLCLHRALYTHNSEGDVDVVFIDLENNFLGTETADGLKIRGFSVDIVNIEKLILSDGTVSTKTPVYVSLDDNKELDERGVMAKNNFVNQLYRIQDVVLKIESTSGDDSFVVSVKQHCDGTPVQGLLLADFVVLNAAGADQVITTSTPVVNQPGYYTLAKANGVVDGTVNLRATAALTVKAYESIGAVALDVTP